MKVSSYASNVKKKKNDVNWIKRIEYVAYPLYFMSTNLDEEGEVAYNLKQKHTASLRAQTLRTTAE